MALATFLVKGSRPTQIALSRFDDEGRPLAALPPTVVVQRPPELGRDEAAGGIGGGQNDTDMVKLRGWLADRCGEREMMSTVWGNLKGVNRMGDTGYLI